MLTDEQWAILEPLFKEDRTGPGRPLLHSDREVLNGVLWVLRAGAAWGICLTDFLRLPRVSVDSVNG